MGRLQGCRLSVFEDEFEVNAVGFTFAFDSSAFTFVSVTSGNAAVGANFTPNTSQTGSGRLGIVLALPTGSAFSAGTKQLALINLLLTPAATGVLPTTLTDQLVTRCVSDAQAGELAVTTFNGDITINATNPPPPLAIAPQIAMSSCLGRCGRATLPCRWLMAPTDCRVRGRTLRAPCKPMAAIF